MSGLGKGLAFSISATMVAVAAASPAGAQAQGLSFDIPRQSAASGIAAFAKRAGVQIIARGKLVKGIRTNAVRGTYSTDEALVHLLRGTGLVARQATGGGIITIEADPRTASRDDAAQADEIVVTGTNIRGGEITSPVTVVTAQDIQRSGYASPDQLIRSMTQVGSSSGPTGFSGIGSGLNAAQVFDSGVTGIASGVGPNDLSGGSGINLRGLGEGSTLVLLNGRRLPAAGSSGGQTTDISAIPMNSIERIEILSNSASAVYGADAVGGVVNIILKKSYRGVEVSGRYGLSSTLADDKTLSGSAGFNWGSGHLLATAYYRRDEPVQVRKFDTPIGDQTARGGRDYRSDRCALGEVGDLPVIIALAGNGLPRQCYYGPAGSGVGLKLSDFVLSTNASDKRYTNYSTVNLTPRTDTLSFTGTISQSIAGTWGADLTGLWSRRRSGGEVTPAFTSIVIPANNPFNPFGRRARTYYDFRGEIARGLFPPTVQSSTFTSLSGNLSLHGALPIPDWQATIDIGYGRNITRASSGSLNAAAIAAAVADTDPATSLNLFGDGSGQNPATLAKLASVTNYPRFVSEERQVTARADGDLVTLPTGTVKVAVGAEYREPRITRTILSGVTLAADGTYARAQKAVFAEAQVPLVPRSIAGPGLEALTLTLAGRQEWFNAVSTVPHASAFTKRIGLAWDVFDQLTLRGQYSTSFRVPYNDQLFAPQITGSARINDPKRGGASTVYQLTSGGNATLQNQTAKSWSGGAAVRFLRNRLTASADYYLIDYRNLVFAPQPADFLTLEDLYPQYFTRAAPEPGQTVGLLQSIKDVYINAAAVKSSGIDVRMNYRLDTARAGYFNLLFQATEILTQKRQVLANAPVVDLRGNALFGSPFSARANLDWSKGIVGTTLAVNYKSPTINPVFGAKVLDVGSLTTLDAQLRVRFDRNPKALRGFTLSIGATNLLDTRSPFLDSEYGIDFYKWDPHGRVVYLTLTKAID